MNSISWNLRQNGPELVDDLVTMVIRNPSPGPWAVPGDYQAEISMGDWSQTVSLKILPDPRWTDVKQADYQAQLDLALEVQAMITDAQRRIKNIRAVKSQLKDKTKRALKVGQYETLESLSKTIIEELDV